MNAAVGPFRTSPPTIGLTATTGARRGEQRLADAGDGEDRGDRGERVGGADHDRARARDRREHLRAGLRLLGAAELEALDDALGALADHELLERAPAGGRADPGAHGVVAHRQHPRAHADRLVQARERRRRLQAVLLAQPRALQAPREVAVAEVEPHLVAELAQRVHHREGVVAQAPAARVDQVGQPEGDEVRVGGDVRAVDLDVIAGVRDHRETRGSSTTSSMPRASFAPPVPPARTTTSPASPDITPRVRQAAPPGGCRRGPCSGS